MEDVQEGMLSVPKGTKARLRCPDEDCWVGDVEVTSKGGVVQGKPVCPSCVGDLEATGAWQPPAPPAQPWLE